MTRSDLTGFSALAFIGLLLSQCSTAPEPDPWPDHARAIADSIRATLIAYQERFGMADRDSLERFYADDPEWRWAANGRFGIQSSLMIRARLDRLAAYQRWFIGYKDPTVRALSPGLALVATEYRMAFEGADGKRIQYDGALTMFWKHLPQGWKIVGGHSSSRSDPEL